MNPYDEYDLIDQNEQFEIVDALLDEDDSEDESRIEFYSENA